MSICRDGISIVKCNIMPACYLSKWWMDIKKERSFNVPTSMLPKMSLIPSSKNLLPITLINTHQTCFVTNNLRNMSWFV